MIDCIVQNAKNYFSFCWKLEKSGEHNHFLDPVYGMPRCNGRGLTVECLEIMRKENVELEELPDFIDFLKQRKKELTQKTSVL